MSRNRAAVVQKDDKTNTWWFVADVGRTADGRRKQAKRRGFPTKKAAQLELDRLRIGVHDQTYVLPRTITFAEYVEGWLTSLETVQGRRPSTMASYRRNMANHVLPRLGGIRLQDLSAEHLNRLYADLRTTGNRKTGRPLSPRTVRYIHTILGKALSDALDADLVMRNVSTRAKPPTAKAAKAPEQRWWKPEELSAFLDGVKGDAHYPLFRLAAMTGMRRGEVCGLSWDDVDLDAGRVEVRRQLLAVDHVLMFSEHPKTDHGRRSIDIDPETVATLRAHRRRQLEQRMLIGAGHTDNGLVFSRIDGSPVNPERVAEAFMRRVARSRLPKIRFHDLRHSHAAHLIAARRDSLEICRRLGHASPGFTLAKYGHLMPKAGSEVAAAVAALVDGGTG